MHAHLRQVPLDAPQRALPDRCSIAFAPAFYGWPYYAGVGAYLQRHGQVHPDARFIGTSAGASVAAFLACGVDILDVGMPASFAANDAQVAGYRTPFFHPAAVRQTFHDHFAVVLPPDAHERASGRLAVIVTPLASMRARAVTSFPTREALLDAIAASMAVPGHGVRLAYRTCSNGWCVDGAFGLGRPCDDRPGWKTIHVGVRRGRYFLPRRLDLEPSRAMSLRSMLAVESRHQRLRWAELGWDDARRYFR
jgi:hypothetical protein